MHEQARSANPSPIVLAGFETLASFQSKGEFGVVAQLICADAEKQLIRGDPKAALALLHPLHSELLSTLEPRLQCTIETLHVIALVRAGELTLAEGRLYRLLANTQRMALDAQPAQERYGSHLRYASALNALAEFHEQQGDPTAAERTYQRALEEISPTTRAGSITVANIKANFADFYLGRVRESNDTEQSSDLSRAHRLSQDSINLIADHDSHQSVLLPQPLTTSGTTNALLNAHAEAEKRFYAALLIREGFGVGDPQQLLDLRRKLALEYSVLGRFADALQTWGQVSSGLTADGGERLLESHAHLAIAYHQLRKVDAATSALKEAQSLSVVLPEGDELLWAHLGVALIYLQSSGNRSEFQAATEWVQRTLAA